MLNNMFACATTKHHGSYVISLKLRYKLISFIKSTGYCYVDIVSKSYKSISMQTGFISPYHAWSESVDLGIITFTDITCLNKVTYNVFGAWDNNAWLILNGIKFTLAHCNWWLNGEWGVPCPYDHFQYSSSINIDSLKSVISNSSNNTITISGGVEDLGADLACAGGANGHIDFTFYFISKRH